VRQLRDDIISASLFPAAIARKEGRKEGERKPLSHEKTRRKEAK
jgi:hypothetical protein